MPHFSFLKAIHPEEPTGVPPFLYHGLCLRHPCLVSRSSLCSGFCGVYSPTAPAVPSLRPLVRSGFLIRWQSVQVFHHHPALLISWGKSSENGQSSYIPGS
jgi:hypothetical protein